IRDDLVTGVQTCALPICLSLVPRAWRLDQGISPLLIVERIVRRGEHPDGRIGRGKRDGRMARQLLEPGAGITGRRGEHNRVRERSEERRVGEGWRWRRWT